jgi:hypothetical protein
MMPLLDHFHPPLSDLRHWEFHRFLKEIRMDTEKTPDSHSQKRWTVAELRRLPPHERDAILEAAAALAEEEYRNNPELTAFEAFGKDDLYGGSCSTEVR